MVSLELTVNVSTLDSDSRIDHNDSIRSKIVELVNWQMIVANSLTTIYIYATEREIDHLEQALRRRMS
jgi:hypothetical protein